MPFGAWQVFFVFFCCSLLLLEMRLMSVVKLSHSKRALKVKH